MAQQVELQTIPVISTAHLDEETAKHLSTEGDNTPWLLCAPYDEGYFLRFHEIDEEAPQCLIDLTAWAKDNGHSWVRLDQDAAPADGLTTYEW